MTYFYSVVRPWPHLQTQSATPSPMSTPTGRATRINVMPAIAPVDRPSSVEGPSPAEGASLPLSSLQSNAA